MTKAVVSPSSNHARPADAVPAGPPPGHITAVVVDASCFSLPYDYSLCEALGRLQCQVVLARSEFLAGDWKRPPAEFRVLNHFYNFSNATKRPKIFRLPWKLIKAGEHLIDMRTFVRRMRDLKPDVIHFQWLPVPLLDGFYLEELSQIAPLVLTVHNSSPHGSFLQRLHQKLRWRSMFRHISAVVAHSEFTKSQIVAQDWVPVDKVHVIHHGVLDYYSAGGGSETSDSPARREILFFGNIEQYKGLDLLIQAFAQLPEEVRASTRLLVAGAPNINVEPMQSLCRYLGIDQQIVWNLGFVAEEKVPQLFRSATVVVLPYRQIDQSGVLMTAVAFGKAIIASRVGGFPEIIRDGISGLLVEPGDIAGLAAALLDVLSHDDRRQSMERMISLSAKTDYSWAQSAEKTKALYEALIAPPRTADVELKRHETFTQV
jgi:glycosyltransferase involved in cell wall biosynthesis